MSARKEIIATLIDAGRPDLANEVAAETAVQAARPPHLQDQVKSAYMKLLIVVSKEHDHGVISMPEYAAIKKALQKILKVS